MTTKIKGHIEQVQVNAANPNIDGTGTIADLITGYTGGGGDDYGTLIQEIIIEGMDTSSDSGMIRFFLKGPSTGDWKLIREVNVYPNYRTGAIQTYSSLVLFDFVLASNWKLGVSTENNQTFDITVFGQDIIGYI